MTDNKLTKNFILSREITKKKNNNKTENMLLKIENILVVTKVKSFVMVDRMLFDIIDNDH